MPPKKSDATRIAEYAADASAISEALKTAYGFHKLGEPALPHLNVQGVTSGSERLSSAPNRRCSEPTVQADIIRRLCARLASHAGRSVQSGDALAQHYLRPVSSFGVAWDDPASFRRFAADIDAYARFRVGKGPPLAAADENAGVQQQQPPARPSLGPPLRVPVVARSRGPSARRAPATPDRDASSPARRLGRTRRAATRRAAARRSRRSEQKPAPTRAGSCPAGHAASRSVGVPAPTAAPPAAAPAPRAPVPAAARHHPRRVRAPESRRPPRRSRRCRPRGERSREHASFVVALVP